MKDHYIAALIGVCVLISATIAGCSYLFYQGLQHPASIMGQILVRLRLSKYRVFGPEASSDSVANLTAEDDRRASISTTTTVSTTSL